MILEPVEAERGATLIKGASAGLGPVDPLAVGQESHTQVRCVMCKVCSESERNGRAPRAWLRAVYLYIPSTLRLYDPLPLAHSRPLMYLIPKPSFTPKSPNTVVCWALLLMHCAEDVMNSTHGVNLWTVGEEKTLKEERTWALSLGEMVLGRVCVLNKELNVQLVGFGKRLLTQPCLFKAADTSSNCLFFGSSITAPFQNPPSTGLRELELHNNRCECVSLFFSFFFLFFILHV